MSYRSERFNHRMLSVEESATGIDFAKCRNVSDCGISTERLVKACDYDDEEETRTEQQFEANRAQRLWEAEMRLADAGKSYLIRVLLLIVENGSDREGSINALTAFSKNWNAARKKYFEHRDRLIEFFKSDSTAHGYIEGHAMPRPVPVQRQDRCNRAGIPSHLTCVR